MYPSGLLFTPYKMIHCNLRDRNVSFSLKADCRSQKRCCRTSGPSGRCRWSLRCNHVWTFLHQLTRYFLPIWPPSIWGRRGTGKSGRSSAKKGAAPSLRMALMPATDLEVTAWSFTRMLRAGLVPNLPPALDLPVQRPTRSRSSGWSSARTAVTMFAASS